MLSIKTERLLIRPFKITDASDMFEYASSDQVGPNAGWKPHTSVVDSEIIIAKFIAQQEVWAIELLESNKVIGSIGLHPDKHRPSINSKAVGYVLHPTYQKQGYMQEALNGLIEVAFDQFQLELVVGYVFDFNDSSKKVLESCGFTYEGTLRKAVNLFEEKVVDLCCYSLIKSEYMQSKGKD